MPYVDGTGSADYDNSGGGTPLIVPSVAVDCLHATQVDFVVTGTSGAVTVTGQGTYDGSHWFTYAQAMLVDAANPVTLTTTGTAFSFVPVTGLSSMRLAQARLSFSIAAGATVTALKTTSMAVFNVPQRSTYA